MTMPASVQSRASWGRAPWSEAAGEVVRRDQSGWSISVLFTQVIPYTPADTAPSSSRSAVGEAAPSTGSRQTCEGTPRLLLYHLRVPCVLAPERVRILAASAARCAQVSADPLPARGRRWGSVRLALERDCGSLLPSLSPSPVQPCTLPAFFLSLFSCSSSFLFFPFPFCCRRTPLVGARCGHTSAAWKSAGSEAFLAGRSL